MSHTPLEKAFTAWAQISKAVETDDGRWLLHGPAALVAEDNLGPDYDGDDLVAKAVNEGLRTFERLGGQVDWDHSYDKTKDPNTIIGKAVAIQPNPDGGADIVTTELFKSKPLAQSAWEHYKAGGALGYSLKGVATARDGKRITGLNIHMLTITPVPKGFEGPRLAGGAAPTLGALVKSLNQELQQPTKAGWKPAAGSGGAHPMSTYNTDDYEDDYSYDGDYGSYSNHASDEIAIADTDSILKAIAEATQAGMETIALDILPEMISKAVEDAILTSEPVQKKIRSIVGGRIEKAIAAHADSLSKALGLPSLSSPQSTASKPASVSHASSAPNVTPVSKAVEVSKAIEEAGLEEAISKAIDFGASTMTTIAGARVKTGFPVSDSAKLIQEARRLSEETGQPVRGLGHLLADKTNWLAAEEVAKSIRSLRP